MAILVGAIILPAFLSTFMTIGAGVALVGDGDGMTHGSGMAGAGEATAGAGAGTILGDGIVGAGTVGAGEAFMAVPGAILDGDMLEIWAGEATMVIAGEEVTIEAMPITEVEEAIPVL